MGKLIFAQPRNKDLNWENMIRWDKVNEDLAKGDQSHLLRTLGKKEGKK